MSEMIFSTPVSTGIVDIHGNRINSYFNQKLSPLGQTHKYFIKYDLETLRRIESQEAYF